MMTKFQPVDETGHNEPGLLLGFSLIGLLVFLGVIPFVAGFKLGPVQPGLGSVLMGVYILAWGVMFLASYFYSHKTFFFRGLIWICEHFSYPADRKMAYFYSTLSFGLGGMGVLSGLGIV